MAALAGELVAERGTAGRVAEVAGVTVRSVERAKKGHAGPRLVARLKLAAQGEVFDEAREDRLALYEARAAAGLGIFSGEPATDAVSVYDLGREADQEELAAALGLRTTKRPSWAV
ncbi:MAG: hypothetical protein KIT58_20130 [Planctomycetota bacterium]|nr:hypothetical protein [Planctomycetota bacterium]